MRKTTILLMLLVLFGSSAVCAQMRQIAILDIPGQPGFDNAEFAAGKLVMTHAGANTVEIFDPVRRRVYARVNNMSQPRGIAVDEQGGRVYIANAGNNTITVLSTQDWQVKDNFKVPHSPNELCIVPETQTLYVSDWHDESVTAVSLKDNNARSQTVGGRPAGMVYDSARKLLLVALEDQSQIVGLTEELKPTVTIALKASQPTGLALDARTRRLFCSVRYAVLEIDADGGAEIARVPTGAGADKLWIDDASHTLYAAAGGGVVTVIRADGGRFAAEQELTTDVRGHAIAVDAAHGLIYMPGGREGRSKLVILKRADSAPQRTQTAASLH